MTEKRFKHSEWYQDDGQLIYWGINDTKKNFVHNMVDEVTVEASEQSLMDLLNELNDENEQLKQTIENICKDYEDAHGMDIRNAEWFNEW